MPTKGNVIQMPSPIVLKRGTLRGMGREAECELLVRKTSVGATNPSTSDTHQYSLATILRAPLTLPDGSYTVTTEDGVNLDVVRMNGRWQVNAQALRDDARETA